MRSSLASRIVSQAVLVDQLDEPAGADLRRRDLRLHVADDEVRRAAVVAEDLPDHVVAAAFLLDLDRVELQPLGIGVGRVDDPAAAGRERAEVEVVRGGRREADEPAGVEDRHDERHVRLVRGAVVGVVVDHDVAGLPLEAELLEAAVDPGDVAGDRAGLQRRRLRRLAQLAALVVAEHAAEVLRLADDRRVGHARQLVAHLDRDRVERAVDHGSGDRVDPRAHGGHDAPAFASSRFPERSARARQPGGTTVVVSRWKTTAGPSNASSSGSLPRS